MSFIVFLRLMAGVGTARVSSPVRSQRDAALRATEAGTGLGATSCAPRASSVKTARKCVPRVKTATTATPFMASALIVTPAGLGTGETTDALGHNDTLCFLRCDVLLSSIMTVITEFLLCVIGVRCAAPTARTARTVRTTAATVLTAFATLSPESACVTRDFMEPSESQDTS